MTDLRIEYRPQGKVLGAFGKSKAFVQILRGPLGAGKTIATCHKLLKYIVEQEPDRNGVRHSQWAVTRNTYPDLLSTTIRDWRTVAPDPLGRFTFGHPPEHKLKFALPDHTTVEANVLFIALDREEDVKKLRGMQLTGGWMNEMKEQPKAIFDMLLSRTDRYKGIGHATWAGVFGDTNAWDDDHWLEALANLYRLGQLPGYEFFVQPGGVIKVDGQWVVNPEGEGVAALREKYYQRQLPGKKEDWIRVNLANEIGLSFDGRPVHPDYSESMHVAAQLLQPIPGLIRVGLDFGLTPAAVFFQRQPTGQWYGLEEIVMDDGDAASLANEIKVMTADLQARCTGGLTFSYRGDPSGDIRSQTDRNTPFMILRANGIPAQPCSSNDAELRRNALDRPLTRLVNGEPGILLSPKMKRLRRALAGGFHYARVPTSGEEDRFRDEPVKDIHSHVAEAAEYALMDAGEHGVVNSANRTLPTRTVMARRDWSPFDA